MKLILGALVIAVAVTACSATPAPEAPRRTETSTTVPEPDYDSDEWWVWSDYRSFAKELSSKHEDAALKCTPDSYTFAASLLQHAVNSTEAQLAQLPVVHRLQVYEMRTTNSALGVFDEAGALRLLLASSRELVPPTDVKEIKISGEQATATAEVPGHAPVQVSFAHVPNAWLIDVKALFDALSATVELNGLTADQYVEKKLAERHGGRAAELRKPMKA
ncbi:hypothetical protein LFM09_38565 [Lentzea alba]|uniref:hypothetical protein n=1 Tax=Lentzea alba TaxID=2714351 RepID=UPI0039BF3279